ncbi:MULTISPECIES: CheR family methyltransferase [Rhizobium/Agrobacterium group]|jgi:chemotaxis protein methyltransferase CheR|uniref:CheR family methyltransferase n=1 Tax=Rhizobium/Agrobacterium group TaxID=227290 RepID=UPI0001FC65E9|nr:protein-glutamate O-methyltransferase CheR [Rhizobium sp. SJZ105]ADY65443.1 chemotaxis protein methyltransferase CheR [Agrobacterium tumefaciens]NSY07302.1 protein-glutamate O-methyltransferase CheR [Agrobacterium tumefaciens]NSZ07191.1 protein-glutamate O-methyltransferase CheR [Agrobacterium tumefaciens]
MRRALPVDASIAASSAHDGLSQRDFRLLAEYIYNYSGIKMPDSKRTMLEGRLRKRLRATGHATFAQYCNFLFREDGLEEEAIYLIDVVTTNKTDFFREPNHFDYMEKFALPALAGEGHGRIRAWSSACSTGAEPYTMAMVLAEAAEKQVINNFSILATDLSTDVLRKAHSGIYARELLEPVPADMMRKYVMRSVDAGRREVRIVPRLRSKIGFARLNLMDPTYQIGDAVHLLFCRNVLIYFDKKTQVHVLTQLCKRLVPGGYLFIGHSETITGIDLPLRQVANTVFKKQ